MDSLSGLDAAFLAAETDTMPLNVGAVLVFDKGKLSELEVYDRILRVLAARIHLIPHLRKRVVNAPLGLTQPYWIDDSSFSLSNHVRLALAERAVDMRAVLEFAGSELAARLDRARPLWNIFIIPKVRGNRFVVIAKLHHALTDGIGGMQSLAVLFDATDSFDPDQRAVEHIPVTAPSQWEVAAKTLIELGDHLISAVTAGVSVARELPAGLGEVPPEERLRKASELMFLPQRSGSSRAISSGRKIFSKSIDFNVLAQIAQANGTTINDVMVTLCHGALISYLRSHDLHVPEALVVMIPVSIHENATNVGSKNKVSALFASIPSNEMDWVELLVSVHQIINRSKLVHSSIGSMFLYNVAEVIPPVLLEAVFRTAHGASIFDVAPPMFNYVVSNVPGPDLDLFLAGNRLEKVIPLAPVADGSGITFAFVSYRGTIDLGIIVDPQLFTDVRQFGVLIDEGLDALSVE